MDFVGNLPIRIKLLVMTMVISSSALLIGFGSFAFYEQSVFRRTLAADSSVLADIFDDNVAGALTFSDVALLTSTLGTLRAQTQILAACVYNDAGAVVASYQRSDLGAPFRFPSARGTDQIFTDNHIDTFREVVLAGQTIGTIYVATDLRDLQTHAWRYFYIVAALILVCSVIALLATSRLQRIISDPILGLARIADAVATQNDYSLRAQKQGNDEVGRLIDGFNRMLDQIQAQNAELQRTGEQLERRVEERTAELRDEVLERRRVAEELKRTDAFLHSLLENLPVSVYRKDKEGRFEFANRRFGDALGKPPEEIIGKSDADFAPPDLAAKYREDDARVMSDRTPLQAVEQHVNSTGVKSWVEIIKVAVVDSGNAVAGTQGMFWDVTARKQAEADVERLNRELLETSRKAGMAEVATGVLHNIGNVLNSVNVSANLVVERLGGSKIAQVPKVAAMLDEHQADLADFLTQDEKGRKIPGYLKLLGEQLRAEHDLIAAELTHLQTHIGHIKDIVAMQQNYARVSGVKESALISDLVEDALRLNAGAMSRHGLTVLREYRDQPTLTIERHKVVQILVNLIRNAKHACTDSNQPEKHLTVRIAQDDGRVRITVIDNGVGIAADNLTRIFAHGFTTRKNGHGFGLHHSALTAKELGGSLRAQSEGTGRGATFILELPLDPAVPPPRTPSRS